MPAVLDRFGLEHNVVQAGMGGGIATGALAGAVSRAGALGTVGFTTSVERFRAELRLAKEIAEGRSYAANLLLPFATREHVEVCVQQRVPTVSLFFGFSHHLVERLKAARITVLHQIGTLAQARRAMAEGCDGLIAQGTSAGGHLLATKSLAELVPRLLDLARDHPVLAAGGIHDESTARDASRLGVAGVVAGTRFVLSEESAAHPVYKERLLRARETLVTLLFGVGWPARHRVVPNAATDRWCQKDPLGPRWVRGLNRALDPIVKLLPKAERAALRAQRLDRPFYTPAPLIRGMDSRLADVTPLYAGSCVERIETVLPAAAIVRELARGAGS